MNGRRALSALVIALVVGGATAQEAIAAPVTTPPTTSNSAPAPSTSTASEDAQVANLAAALSALEAMPQDLQQRAPSDPEVQAWITNNIADPVRPGGVVTPRFNPFTCAAAVAEFAIGIGLPASKLIRIAKEAGGFTKFARYVFDFVRKGTLPADASEEIIDVLLKVTGVGSLSSCL